MSRVEYGAGPQLATPSGWAVGGVLFAASMMVLMGTFQVLGGLAAIVNDNFFVVTHHYAFNVDVTAWGWFNVIFGAVIVAAGIALFSQRTWAAIVALVLAGLSMIDNFLFLPHYPFWSLLVIAIDAWIIWALTRPGAIAPTP
jgi:hypothetical protein